jgi:hypothetical protein
MTNSANIERARAAKRPGDLSPKTVVLDPVKPQRAIGVASNISRGSGAVRGNRGPVNTEAYGDYSQRPCGGHSETEQSITSAENCVKADLHNVTLKVYRPVTRVTDGGRELALLPPFYFNQEA